MNEKSQQLIQFKTLNDFMAHFSVEYRFQSEEVWRTYNGMSQEQEKNTAMKQNTFGHDAK